MVFLLSEAPGAVRRFELRNQGCVEVGLARGVTNFLVISDGFSSLFFIDFLMVFLMIFWFKFECQGIQKQAFGMEGIAKINFRRDWISYDSRVDFS